MDVLQDIREKRLDKLPLLNHVHFSLLKEGIARAFTPRKQLLGRHSVHNILPRHAAAKMTNRPEFALYVWEPNPT